MKTNKWKEYAWMIVLSILVVLALLLAVDYLIFSSGSSLMEGGLPDFIQSSSESDDLAYRLGDINLSSSKDQLVLSLDSDDLEVGVANRSQVPLMDQVEDQMADRQPDKELPEDYPDAQPWFYYSPQVPLDSKESMAQGQRLISDDSLEDFAFYLEGQDLKLLKDGQAYSGFHHSHFDGWSLYQEGMIQDYQIPILTMEKMSQDRQIMADLAPRPQENQIYIDRPADRGHMVDVKPVNDHILYKATDKVILSAPPGLSGSSLVTTTENFYEIPMEVVEEAETFDGTWLHVYIGYDELGWIEKDESGQDYVPTYYSERELLDSIEYAVEEELANIDAIIGVSFINNETMAQVSVQDQSFFPASTQKIYVLGELYHQYAHGLLDPYETWVTLYDENKVPGAGVLQGYPAGSAFTLDELVDLVGIYSDNTAANMLIDAVGGGEIINPDIQRLGLYGTSINGKYYDETAFLTTTPHDAARFFALLYNDRVNGAPWDEQLIEKFYLNSHTFLRAYIPESTRGWNKSGLGYTEQNDVATFVTPYGSYSIAVYSSDPGNRDYVAEQIGYLSLRVHDVFNELRSKLWITVEDSDEDVEVNSSSMEETDLEFETEVEAGVE